MGFVRRALGLEPSERRGSTPPVPPSRSSSSRAVTPDQALGLTGVYRAFQILATAVGGLTMGTYRGENETPANLIVERPDVDRSRRSHIKRTVVCLAGHGEFFWRAYRDPSGRPSVLRVLDPNLVYVGRDGNGRRFFDYRDPYRVDGFSERLDPVADHGNSGDILHGRLLEVPGMDHGLGPIQACRLAISGGLDLAGFADEWFNNADVPTGVLSTTQQLNSDDADRYRERWEASQGGRRGVAVLGAGLSYAPILLKPADAQFLESRQFSITDQARMMGIPAPYLLAEVNGSSLTYQNLEQVDQTLLKYTIANYTDAIEDAFSEVLPAGVEARFKPWSFLRSDNATRAEINKTYVDLGVKSREQVAREEGFTLPASSATSPAGSVDNETGEPANA